MEKKIVRSRVSGCIQAPSSKSYAQRSIAASLLAEGESTLYNMELCSDTRAALDVIQILGAKATQTDSSTFKIKGGIKALGQSINIGESGLSARMFTPIASLCDRSISISGRGSMLKRPMDMLLQPLRDLGVHVSSNRGRLPFIVCGPMTGGETTIDGSVSSQFTTGLLMALPLAEGDTTFRVTEVKSIPYINMTIDVLRSFGIEVKHNGYTEFFVEGKQKYVPREYNIEGDWSGASCLLVAGAVAGGITIRNLNPMSMQADVAIIDALSRAGAEITTTSDSVTVKKPKKLLPFTFDATNCPDLFPALAALAVHCDGESIIKGTSRLKHKESDRKHTIQEEFEKMDIVVDIDQPDIMRIFGGTTLKGAKINTHGDHRIAMATAVAALDADGETIITNAEVVEKSYPDFWDDLQTVIS